MPVATVTNNTERLNLKSCPGGWVELRRMTYGQLLERRSMAMKMQMEAGGKGESAKMDIDMSNRRVVEYEFKHCIMDHNLTDELENPLDLTRTAVLTILDPRIGDEISEKINDMHDFEAELGNLPSPLGPISS
jgi:hypothetical protein